MHHQLFLALFALAVLALTFAVVDHPVGGVTFSVSALAACLSATPSVLSPPRPTPATATGLADANVSTASATPGPEPLAPGNKLDDSAEPSLRRRIHGHLDNALYYALVLFTLYLHETGYYDWNQDDDDDDEEDEDEEVEDGGNWHGGWEEDDGHNLRLVDGAPDWEAMDDEDLEEVDWVLYAICALSLASFTSQMLSPVSWLQTFRTAAYFITGMVAHGGDVLFPKGLWHCMRWVQEVDQACALYVALRMAERRPTLLEVLLPTTFLYSALGLEICYLGLWYHLGWRRTLLVLEDRGLL